MSATILNFSRQTVEDLRKETASILNRGRIPASLPQLEPLPPVAARPAAKTLRGHANAEHIVHPFMEYCDLRGLKYGRMDYDIFCQTEFPHADQHSLPCYDAVSGPLQTMLRIRGQAQEDAYMGSYGDDPAYYPPFGGAPGFAGEDLLVQEPDHPLVNAVATKMAGFYPDAEFFLVAEVLDVSVFDLFRTDPKLTGRPGSCFGAPGVKPDALGREPACFAFDCEPELYYLARQLKKAAPYARLHMRLREDDSKVVRL